MRLLGLGLARLHSALVGSTPKPPEIPADGRRTEVGGCFERRLDGQHFPTQASEQANDLDAGELHLGSHGLRPRRITTRPRALAFNLFGYFGAWGWIGLLPIATGIIRFCPAYWPLGPSTCLVRPGASRP